MLKPDRDRLDYSEIIMPPVDYETSFAIGTTYSLDLETLLGIPLALSLAQSMEGQLRANGLHLLEAIRKSADNIMVFCQGGKISVPAEKRTVFSLLENSVYQVLPKANFSFHPKMWIVKYNPLKKEDEVKYKIIVLSRNLTFDRSWDTAVALDGVPSNKEMDKNKPLADFINYLSGFVGYSERRKKIKAFVREIMNIDFKLESKDFNEFSFLPLGIPYYSKESSGLFNDTYHSLAVISPFISKTSIEELNKLRLSNADVLLLSRKSELCKLDGKLATEIECWHMKDCVIDGEDVIEEEGNTCKQDIHSKIYLKTKYSTSELWIGSANCSHKAFNGNIEFLMKLKGPKGSCNINSLRQDLFGEEDKSNPFERFVYTEKKDVQADNPEEVIADRLIREICKAKAGAKVEENTEDKELFNINLSFNNIPQIPEETQVSIFPLLSPGNIKKLSQNILFEGIGLTKLGLFYGVKINIGTEYEKQVLIKIPTEYIPDIRNSEIFKSIIKDKNGFIQYIAFLLGDDFLLTSLEEAMEEKGSSFKLFGQGYEKPVLYEKMLRAASRSPERLVEIKRVMDFLQNNDKDIVPEEFKGLYKVFDDTVQKVWRIKK